MSDYILELYAQFIRPYVKSQPICEPFDFYFQRHERESTIDAQDDCANMLTFYACHAFLLGLRMGWHLSDDL